MVGEYLGSKFSGHSLLISFYSFSRLIDIEKPVEFIISYWYPEPLSAFSSLSVIVVILIG